MGNNCVKSYEINQTKKKLSSRFRVLIDGCVTPFANALRKLSAHANPEGKKVIQEMIAEVTKRSTCVEKGDLKCIHEHLAQSVGIEDMIKLKNGVEPKLRSTIAQMKAKNQEAIGELKTAKPGKEARDIVCNVRITKSRMIDEAIAK